MRIIQHRDTEKTGGHREKIFNDFTLKKTDLLLFFENK